MNQGKPADGMLAAVCDAQGFGTPRRSSAITLPQSKHLSERYKRLNLAHCRRDRVSRRVRSWRKLTLHPTETCFGAVHLTTLSPLTGSGRFLLFAIDSVRVKRFLAVAKIQSKRVTSG